jgi:hypothetical protein
MCEFAQRKHVQNLVSDEAISQHRQSRISQRAMFCRRQLQFRDRRLSWYCQDGTTHDPATGFEQHLIVKRPIVAAIIMLVLKHER